MALSVMCMFSFQLGRALLAASQLTEKDVLHDCIERVIALAEIESRRRPMPLWRNIFYA